MQWGKFMYKIIVVCGIVLHAISAHGTVTHASKEVLVIHSPDDRECLFFQLSGVVEADPITPSVSWFAVPKTHPGYKEIFGLLSMARLSSKALTHVATNGKLACGHAAVQSVAL
jgi:hypothetical protein